MLDSLGGMQINDRLFSETFTVFSSFSFLRDLLDRKLGGWFKNQ